MSETTDPEVVAQAGRTEQRRVTTCSFCKRSSRDAGPMVEGPDDVYICSRCTEFADDMFIRFPRDRAARLRIVIRVLKRRLEDRGQAVPPAATAADETAPARQTTCSFCGKGSSERGRMAEGPGDVYICVPCAQLGIMAAAQEDRKEYVELLRYARALRAQVDVAEKA